MSKYLNFRKVLKFSFKSFWNNYLSYSGLVQNVKYIWAHCKIFFLTCVRWLVNFMSIFVVIFVLFIWDYNKINASNFCACWKILNEPAGLSTQNKASYWMSKIFFTNSFETYLPVVQHLTKIKNKINHISYF
jgi:hypothetical protein